MGYNVWDLNAGRPDPRKLEVAARFGATHLINGRKQDMVEAVVGLLHQGRPEVVIDGTGNPEVLEKALALTSPQGRCIGFGVMAQDRKLSFNTLPLHLGKRLTGSHGGDSQPALDIPRLVRMMQAGVFDPRGFVSHRVTLGEVNEAIAKMRAGEVIHALIHFDQPA